MKKEIEVAVVFLKNLVKRSHKLNSVQVDAFVERLMDLLQEKYKGHWYPENPTKGQGFRCIRVSGHHRMQNAELLLACQKSGVEYCSLGLPLELTLWVDPGEVCVRYSEDTPPFTVARITGDDDDEDHNDDNDNENVLLKVKNAVEKVTSDCHSETSSDDDCACISPPPENDGAFTASPPERAGDWVKASPQSICAAGLSTENNTVSDTLLPAKRHSGGATTTLPRKRSPSLQVVYRGPQSSSPPSWKIPVRSPVEPQPYFMLNPHVKPTPHGWPRPVYHNPIWSSGRSHHRSSAAIWSFVGNERRFQGKMNFNRQLK